MTTTQNTDQAHLTDEQRLQQVREVVADLGHLVGGRLVPGDGTFTVTAPWLGAPLAECPSAGMGDLDAAVAAAKAAQPAWAADEPARVRALHAIADAIEANAELLGTVLAAETGKPIRIATGEPMGAAAHVRYHADEVVPTETLIDDDEQTVLVVHEPIGVVAAITPWNGPLLMLANKIAAALRVGNTVVAKPSPYTPLASLLFGRIVQDLVPPGVINVLAGGDELGVAMTQHVDVSMVSFTGSIRAGKAIMQQSADGLRRLQLELGGNDAAVVLPDVDVQAIAPRIYRGAFALSGQICAAVKRLYVHESIAEELVEALTAIARTHTPGTPWDPETTMGPSTTRPQFEYVQELVDDAVAAGATVVTGGSAPDRDGFFLEPTILTGVDNGIRVVDEEQFGPVLPVMTFTDIDEVLERVNATDYGLGGSVWTRDTALALDLARRFESGSTWINRHPHVGAEVPFGGVKLSGLGREGGPRSYEGFSEPRTISILKEN
ncbi:aldehyde dehydrogenase [Pseudoclavibacter endophyticus]|uniref:Aldehyde dehydrogenase family protein n=1 Tax=Pseudoclavibacter endophyticus TaxID=1778590 RepID=A0A6H9WAW6_9MICO|nr:aldehyde dehydrogenase family protein [Pseudoclavibacter endophyticus]KAB1646904.1 aldehyde dehydrogenase family protein [Pseudoclavibacter endophyticus]GGA74556.1 aldehyde dehydrogenase [Pseudoclavibacter endophyticus]